MRPPGGATPPVANRIKRFAGGSLWTRAAGPCDTSGRRRSRVARFGRRSRLPALPAFPRLQSDKAILTMTIGTRLYTWLRGQLVGSDAAGNRYYRDRTGASRADGMREKRWVLFNGEVEASRVPPEWHGWLHHAQKDPPPVGGPPMRPWQTPHQPNLPSPAYAYPPPGQHSRGGRRAAATGDYQPWTPS